ncbi:hypothetical protein D3C81_1644070 [compost metagenome]
MRLAQQGGDQHPAARTHVPAGQLIGQDGLARTRRALNDVGGAGYQAALQQRIEPFDTCHQPPECLRHDAYLSSGLLVLS